MEDCFTSTPNADLTPPMAHIIKVLKTKTGLPFEEDEVIAFYSKYYESRGWRNITGKDNKLTLEFRVDVYDQEAKQAQIQASGQLSIWLAPKDGMLTIYMHQWRISSLHQDSRILFEKTEKDLNNIAAEKGYKISQSYGPNWWIKYYENEYLVRAKLFSMSSKTVYPKGPGLANCTNPKGRITVLLLAYRDFVTAQEQAKRFERINDFNQHVVTLRDNILVLFENRDRSQDTIVMKIASELEK